jgi:hypothetical protein
VAAVLDVRSGAPAAPELMPLDDDPRSHAWIYVVSVAVIAGVIWWVVA